MKQTYILGIDTGGTYTDSVILDSSQKVVCYSKALTTKEDLRIGIRNSINKLEFTEFSRIGLVSLSTTLATNAIVEGKGCKTGLILIGKEPVGRLPAQESVLVKGSIDINGSIRENIDAQEVAEAVAKMEGHVESIAISGYASVRNPKLEQSVREVVSKTIKHPVFCAHELTGTLGFYERTVTSILNASLVKLIRDFILSTKSVLEQKKIAAPVMVVKGDGSLMHEAVAVQKPIETILSGPSASILGASYLTGLDDALIVDMGGTTSDIVEISGKNAKIQEEGAKVGGWKTRVRAASVCTYGLGGDSLFRCAHDGTISIGPEKVEPLCVTSAKFPGVLSELKLMKKNGFQGDVCLYRRGKIFSDMLLSETERAILKVLGNNIRSAQAIAQKLKMQEKELRLDSLIKNGSLIRCAVTPTDLLHALGEYTDFDVSSSELAIELTATAGGYTKETFLEAAKEQITRQLYLFCLQSAAAFEEHDFDFQKEESSMYLLDKAFQANPDEFLKAEFSLNKPIVGVGAPAHAWLPAVAEKLNTRLFIPQYAKVTNALGAALGQVAETAHAMIRPAKQGSDCYLYLPDQTLTFDDMDLALRYAKAHLAEYLHEKTRQAGGDKIEITISSQPVYTQAFNSRKKRFIETRIDAYASAVPEIFV